jgi:hypothetical protein
MTLLLFFHKIVDIVVTNVQILIAYSLMKVLYTTINVYRKKLFHCFFRILGVKSGAKSGAKNGATIISIQRKSP